MELAHPLWLGLLSLPLAWAFLAWRTRREHTGAGAWLLHHPHLAEATTASHASEPRLPILLQALAFALLILALAQPRQEGVWITPPPQGRDIALVIDTSLTMSIDDFVLDGKKVPRLAVLKALMGRFIRGREGDRFAILAFGSRAATLTPPTFDRELAIAQLQRLQVGMAGNDTALGDALGLALKQVSTGSGQAPSTGSGQVPAIILVSDGADSNSGDLTPAEALAVARQLGVAVHCVQLGSDLFAQGRQVVATADPQPGLEEIARGSGGHFYRVKDTSEAEAMIRDIGALEPTLSPPPRHRVTREWYWLPLALAAACLGLARLSALRRQAA
jgi:Ca-activated chloride channel family protein